MADHGRRPARPRRLVARRPTRRSRTCSRGSTRAASGRWPSTAPPAPCCRSDAAGAAARPAADVQRPGRGRRRSWPRSPPRRRRRAPRTGRPRASPRRSASRKRPGVARILHQADWIAGRLSGRFDVSDENNALKTGYDPVGARAGPTGSAAPGRGRELLPDVVAPGSPIGHAHRRGRRPVRPAARDVVVVAGTTDGCASFLATGAAAPGEGVTALGSSLTIKLLSDTPIFAPAVRHLQPPHRRRLAGGRRLQYRRQGAARTFPRRAHRRRSRPRSTPRPNRPRLLPAAPARRALPDRRPAPCRRAFRRGRRTTPTSCKAMLEGIAAVEALAYRRLARARRPGARPRCAASAAARRTPPGPRSASAGSACPSCPRCSEEAAAGTARLALAGAQDGGRC